MRLLEAKERVPGMPVLRSASPTPSSGLTSAQSVAMTSPIAFEGIRRTGPAGNGGNPIEFSLATCTDALESAFRLVHDRYVAQNYMPADRSGLRLNLHHILPTTKVFTATVGHRVIGTMTLIQDSPLGLPMDEIYDDELAGIRGRRRRVAEVSAFAIDEGYRTSGAGILIRLIRMLVLYAAEIAELDDVCIAVNPRHVGFYLRAFPGGQQLGALKPYQKVNGAPAVALHLDLDVIRRLIVCGRRGDPVRGGVYPFLFDPAESDGIIASLLRKNAQAKLTSKQVVYFFSHHDGLRRASPSQQGFVQSLYPHLDFTALGRCPVPSSMSPPRYLAPSLRLVTVRSS
jgi:N-acyl amino acid synthase FeeM